MRVDRSSIATSLETKTSDLPGASELFRETKGARPEAAGQQPAESTPEPAKPKHDEKITVYISSEQLLALEQARLKLKAEYGLRVDRGKLVRAAVALALDELDELGRQASVVKMLEQE